MCLHRSSNRCFITRSMQILAAAERHPAWEGACGRLGDECNWLDYSFGMDVPPSWQQVTDSIPRSC